MRGHSPLKRNSDWYDELAAQEILTLLEREHAAVWLEIEAKLADRPHPLLPRGINPHHLSNARLLLLRTGQIEQLEEGTRGGRRIAILALAHRPRQETVFLRTAARKRLLQARYLGWGVTSRARPNMIGEAGERVAHASLAAAVPTAGYRLVNPSGGPVGQLFGEPVPVGPLDDAAYALGITPQGLPVAVTILVEVKNVRHWMYPSSVELFQLLEKAARLQIAHPDQSLVPVLVCRRAQFSTFNMAKDLGFMVFYTVGQPILPHSEVDPTALEEVRTELGYDLVRGTQPHTYLTRSFADVLPLWAGAAASRWAATAPVLADNYARLRVPTLTVGERRAEMDLLGEAVVAHFTTRGGWHHGADEPEIDELL